MCVSAVLPSLGLSNRRHPAKKVSEKKIDNHQLNATANSSNGVATLVSSRVTGKQVASPAALSPISILALIIYIYVHSIERERERDKSCVVMTMAVVL